MKTTVNGTAQALDASTTTPPLPIRCLDMTADATDKITAPVLLFLLERLGEIAKYIERDLRRQFGLSLGEYEVLAALERSPLAQAELSRHTHSSGAAVSRWLLRLVREGWVVRRHPAHDGREFVANITQRGRNQLRRIRCHLAEALHPMSEALTPEDEHLLARLGKNLTHLLDRLLVAATESQKD